MDTLTGVCVLQWFIDLTSKLVLRLRVCQCHALAAALSVKAVFVPPNVQWHYFDQLVNPAPNETADVVIIGLTRNMERTVNGRSTETTHL